MPDSFSIALSALKAHNRAIDVTGNNLANLNTSGFKSSGVSFRDLVAQTIGTGSSSVPPGAGVGRTIATREFSQGSIQITSGALDAAIQGDGFFALRDQAGNQLFTRAGNFVLDSSGNLLTLTGERVQGWTAAAGVINPNGAIGDINVPFSALLAPVPTQAFSLDVNLDATGVVGQNSGTFSAPIEVVDSLGGTHVLTVVMTKTAANAWSYEVFIPGEDVAAGVAGVPESLAQGNLTFDGQGQLTAPAPPPPAANGVVAINIAGLTNGAADLPVNWQLYAPDLTPRLTQYAQTSALSASEQDGSIAAQLLRVAIADGGRVVAQYSSGDERTVAQLALASIRNPDSMAAVGNNNFKITVDTTTPALGTADAGGRGSIVGGAIEGSTVDLAREFTNLIVYQRGYQANSRVITTADEISQETLNLKR